MMENENLGIEKKYHISYSDLVFDHETSSISSPSSLSTASTAAVVSRAKASPSRSWSGSHSSGFTNEPVELEDAESGAETTPPGPDVPIIITTVRRGATRYFIEPHLKERSVTRY